MLKVTIELYPGGLEENSKVLGVMQISQKERHEKVNGDTVEYVCDYTVVANEGANPVTGQPPTTGKYTIRNIDRNQSVYSLVAKATAEVARGFRERVKRKAYATAKESEANK